VAKRRIKCALLTAPAAVYDAELSLACPGLEFVALSPSAVGLTKDQAADAEGRGAFGLNSNRFALPEDDTADVVLIESFWYRLAAERHPDQIDDVMRNLERRADLLVGLDADQFALGFPPSALERLAVVIEFDGLYRDRELYNYFVGSRYPGGNWTEKLRPRPWRYRASDLDKLRLSVPCFMKELPVIRRAARARHRKSMSRAGRMGRNLGEAWLVRAFGLPNVRERPFEVHCVVAPTHPQRLDAVRLLEGFSGSRGILDYGVARELDAPRNEAETGDPEDDLTLAPWPARSVMDWMEASSAFLASAKRPGPGQPALLGELLGVLEQEAAQLKEWRALLTSASPFARQPVSRLRYLLELRRHQIAVAPTGAGELTYRHGEALMTGAALVCQDLSHVEMMFPFRDQENVVFCRPDLSDLRSTVEELLRDDNLRRRVAREGRRSFTAWAARWREHLYDGIEAHIRQALGEATE
jgi:Glycosyl transferases group 1